MHVARSDLGVAVVDGKIYAIGGTTRRGGGSQPYEGGITGVNEEYNPTLDNWVLKSPMPYPTAGIAMAVFQDKICCISSNLTQVYDPATNTWERKTPMPTARTGVQANVINGRIYIVGGYVSDNSTSGFSITSINEAYDPVADSWTAQNPMPNATSIYSSAVIDNKLYIIGGDGAGTLNQIYDPQYDSWQLGAPLSSSIAYGAAGATLGINATKRIYVLGQYLRIPEQPYVNQVYDPYTNTWQSGVPIPTGRRGFGVCVVNDVLYAIGGFTETYSIFPFSSPYGPSITPLSTNEQYTPIGYGIPDPSYQPSPTPLPSTAPTDTPTEAPTLTPPLSSTLTPTPPASPTQAPIPTDSASPLPTVSGNQPASSPNPEAMRLQPEIIIAAVAVIIAVFVAVVVWLKKRK